MLCCWANLEVVAVPLTQLIPDITFASETVNVIAANDLEHIKEIGVGGFAVVFKGGRFFIIIIIIIVTTPSLTSLHVSMYTRILPPWFRCCRCSVVESSGG